LEGLETTERLAKRDPTLYPDGKNARRFMGWLTLASQPPFALSDIEARAEELLGDGIRHLVVVGEGGSSQAVAVLAQLFKPKRGKAHLSVLDGLSPLDLPHFQAQHTLCLISSKSGTTMETRTLERVLRARLDSPYHFVAISDPGSDLQDYAQKQGYRFSLSSPSNVGGRFSALSVFGLFPAAMLGIKLAPAMAEAAQMEARCRARLSRENPALQLAARLFAEYSEGRDKICFLTPPGLESVAYWLKQLIAESLGKSDSGLYPCMESDFGLFKRPWPDVQAYRLRAAELETPGQLFSFFVFWEYVVAYLGVLFELNPFDQPDVELTKRLTREHLQLGQGQTSLNIDAQAATQDPRQALLQLLGRLRPGDFFSINAFLPQSSIARRCLMETMRYRVVSALGHLSSLEVGPRYLHSVGQYQKGGRDNGVYLLLGAPERQDLQVPGEDWTLGQLALTQAKSDYEALLERGRRVLFLELRDTSEESLAAFVEQFCAALAELP
jgi:glucose-6-phosphate isomerase